MTENNLIKKVETTIQTNKFLNSFNNKFNKPLTKLQMLVIFFFLYAIIGWCIETVYSVYTLGYFEKRGFLYGPLCPIYGYGAIILLVALQPFKKNKLMLFIISAVIFSVFEYLVGYGLDALFGMKFWDYSNDFLNINGRIALWFSVVWGIFGILFMNYIHPVIEHLNNITFKKTNFVFQHFILYLIGIIYIVDTVMSIIKYVI